MIDGFSLYGAPDTTGDYDARDRKRRLAEALMQQGMDYSPVRSWTQGASRLAQALVGGYESGKYDREQKAADAPTLALMRELSKQGMPPSASPYTAGPVADTGGAPKPNLPAMASGGNIPRMVMPDPMSANLTPQQRGLLNAIAAPESAGAYNIRYTPRGGATFAGFDAHPGVYEPGPAGPSSAAGRYQFTKTTWDRMGGGAFTPENQDQRALALASEDYTARTGRDLMADINANGFTPEIAKALGPTWRGLIDNPQKAIAAYQATVGRGQPTQVAQANVGPAPMPGGSDFPQGPVPSNAPPMAYAASPAGAAINGAAPMPQQRPAGQQLTQAVSAPPMPAPQPTGNVGAALLAAATSPGVSPALRKQAMDLYTLTQRDEGVTTVDLGDRVATMNKRGQITGYLPKGRNETDEAHKRAQTQQIQQQMSQPRQVDLGNEIVFVDNNNQVVNRMAKERGLQYQNDADGNIIAIDPTGRQEPKVVHRAAVKPTIIQEGATAIVPDGQGGYRTVGGGGPKPTDRQRDYNYYVQQESTAGREPKSFSEWDIQQRRASSTNVNIDNKTETAADTEAAKALIKRNVAAVEAGDKAAAAMTDINTMREISRRVGSVGSTADLKGAIGPYAEALGIQIDGLSDIQAFEAVIQRLAPTMRAEGSGSTSDIEFKGMLASLPRLRNNPQAREMILDTMEANARYNMMRGEISLGVLTKDITRQDAEKRIKELGDPMAAFKAFKKANPALFAGPAPKDEPRQKTREERALEILQERSRM